MLEGRLEFQLSSVPSLIFLVWDLWVVMVRGSYYIVKLEAAYKWKSKASVKSNKIATVLRCVQREWISIVLKRTVNRHVYLDLVPLMLLCTSSSSLYPFQVIHCSFIILVYVMSILAKSFTNVLFHIILGCPQACGVPGVWILAQGRSRIPIFKIPESESCQKRGLRTCFYNFTEYTEIMDSA